MNYESADTWRKDEAICPYCNHTQSDSWELPDAGVIECQECFKDFYVYRHIDVSYSTQKED